MDLREFEKTYIFTTRIELETGDYIVLREPTASEMKGMAGKEGQEVLEQLTALFPHCVVEHSFTANDKPAKNREVGELIIRSSSSFVDILTEWMESLPINQKKKQE
jgi:hypothetical protein